MNGAMHPAVQALLHAADPEIADLIAAEERRQRDKIRLIASGQMTVKRLADGDQKKLSESDLLSYLLPKSQ